MPELAEVAYFASIWSRAIGQRFSPHYVNYQARCCRDLSAESIGSRLRSAPLIATQTHGKRMLFSFGEETHLEVHLGMTGSLGYEKTGREPLPHEHFMLISGKGLLVFKDPRQFGRIRLHRHAGTPDWWLALPPQPQDARFTFKRFESCRGRKSRSPLKAFLLDQGCFPGVGNWMADEILWQGRLRPSRFAGSLSQEEAEALFKSCKRVCREALRSIGVDFRDPPASWLFHHRWRDGGTCPQSGEPLTRETIGGRTTCWSPAWQS